MDIDDEVLANLVSKAVGRNKAAKKLKLMASESGDVSDPTMVNVESSRLEIDGDSRKKYAKLKDNALLAIMGTIFLLIWISYIPISFCGILQSIILTSANHYFVHCKM